MVVQDDTAGPAIRGWLWTEMHELARGDRKPERPSQQHELVSFHPSPGKIQSSSICSPMDDNYQNDILYIGMIMSSIE